jgi:hypothetical protein
MSWTVLEPNGWLNESQDKSIVALENDFGIVAVGLFVEIKLP